MAWTPARRRLAAVLGAGLVPWTLLFVGGELSAVFTFGIFNTNPPELTGIYAYYFRYTGVLPDFLDAWGLGVLLYLVGLGSAVAGVVWREDRRLTAGTLAFAGLSQVWVTAGFGRRLGTTAVPVGTVVLLAVVWWHYWPELRRLLTLRTADG